ncbi:hypothetical protein [Cerasicoccus fimbriatus]|uniref:hypothetical protein n=1 Tax=Cerasicoccus fimbriatus TaxID=3014554 RepID=UPI0022B2E36D|nr:hypothetical protein [Cerasicoccus sp. TK19100]
MLAALIPSAQAATADNLTIQIVDDSGIDNLYFLLSSGKEAITLASTPGATGSMPAMGWPGEYGAVPMKISDLPTTGATVTSPYTGNTPTIYTFEAEDLNSGKFLFLQGTADAPPDFTYTANTTSPSFVTAPYRFDLCEVTFLQDADSGSDITSIDQLGIQIQMELFDTSGKLLDSKYYYKSTFSLLQEIESMHGVKGSDAMLEVDNSGSSPTTKGGWTTAGDPTMSKFLRALGPTQLSAPPGLSPAPYPDFKTYLEAIIAAGVTVNLSGAAEEISGESSSSTYDYTGTFEKVTDSTTQELLGYQVSLTGTTTNIPTNNPDYPANADMTVNLPIPQQAQFEVELEPVGIYALIQGSTNSGGYPESETINCTVTAPQTAGGTTAVVQAQTNASGFLLAYPNGSLFNVVDAGSGYTSPPTVTVPGGDQPFSVKAYLNESKVSKVKITDGGYGYYEDAVLIINGSSLPAIGTDPAPTYTPAQATVRMKDGKVHSVDFTGTNDTQGSGFGDFNQSAFVTAYTANNAPQSSYNFNIYGAPLNQTIYSVGDLDSAQMENLSTNSVYGAMTRDVLAALNFGYVNGIYGEEGPNWYGTAPTAAPFGLARKTNDGHYNPWAATIFNHSDAYSFAFSDRGGGPSPLMVLQAGQILRITILPDDRLDSPTIQSATSTLKSGDAVVDLTWDKIDGATGYKIDVKHPSGIGSYSVSGGSSVSHTLGDGDGITLPTGTPITLGVAATKGSLESPIQYMVLTTAGDLVPISGGTDVQMNVKWTDRLIPPRVDTSTLKFYLNGVEYPLDNENPPLKAVSAYFNAAGADPAVTNQYAFVVTADVEQPDGSKVEETVFQNVLEAQYIYTDGTESEFLAPVNEMIGSEQSLTIAYAGGSTSPYSTTGLVMTLNLVPELIKQTTDVVTPPLKSYGLWAAQYPGMNTAYTANDDGDMHPNLLEYFFGTDPLVDRDNRYPELEVTPDYLRLTFPISKTYQGFDGELFWSSNLTHWFTANVESYEEVDMGDHTLRTALIPNPGLVDGDGIFFQIVLFEE